MRASHYRRSTASWIIWSAALVGMVIAMGWHFGWMPGSREPVVLDESEKSPVAGAPAVKSIAGSPAPPAIEGQQEPPASEPPFLKQDSERVTRISPASTADKTAYKPPAVPAEFQPAQRKRPSGFRPVDRTSIDPAFSAEPRKLAADDPTPLKPQDSTYKAHPLKNSGVVQTGFDRPAKRHPRQDVEPAAAQPSSPPADVLAEIDAEIRAGQLLAAHKRLSKMYWNQPQWRRAIQARIEKTARTIYFDPQPDYIPPYEVKHGDVLSAVARSYNLPWEYVAMLNRTRPERIRPGQKLKVLKGPFSAVVDLSDRELTIHHYGYFVKRYDIGIGKDGRSPLGKFYVGEKLVNPTYYGSDGVIAANNPANPLGERWLGLWNEGGKTAFGLHGTINEASIGKAESKGCIRLRNADVAEVFDLLGPKSEVVMQR